MSIAEEKKIVLRHLVSENYEFSLIKNIKKNYKIYIGEIFYK